MTINSTAAFSGPFTGTGLSQVLPFDFQAASAAEIVVEVDGAPVTGFSVTLEGDNTGSVTGAFAVGGVIYINSAPSFQQDTDFSRFAPYFPDSINGPLDRAAIRDIALYDMALRAPIVPRNFVDAAGKFPTINSEGGWTYVDGVPGVAGPASAFRSTLAALKAASVTDGQSTYAGALWTWTAGNFTGRADDVTVVQSNTTPITVGAWVRQMASSLTFGARSYGARGDGVTNDANRLQIAINDTGQTSFLIGGSLPLPPGQYATATDIGSSQFWSLKGSGLLASFFVNTGPAATNLFTMGSYGFVTYDDVGVRGYKSFVRSTGNVEQVSSRNVHIYNSSGYAFDIGGYLITGQFDGLHIDGNNRAGAGGFKVGGSFNNLLFNTLQMNNLTDNGWDLQFSEGVVTTNMRVEGGNAPGKSVYKLAASTHQHITTIGAYIEGAHQYVVSADGAGTVPYDGPGVLSFIGSHFTFFTTGVPHKWAITSPFVLLGNDFTVATRVPPTAQVLGYNQGLIRSEYASHTPFVSKRRRPATVSGTGPWVQDVVVFTRPVTTNTPKNQTTFCGRLRYTASWSNADGGANGSTVREFQVVLGASGGGNIGIILTPIGMAMDGGNASSVLTIAASGSPSPTGISVLATWNGINPTTIANFDQQWALDWAQSAGFPEATFGVSEPGA